MPGYRERPVDAVLRSRVVCAWANGPNLRARTILPDACIDIVWDGARLSVAGPATAPFTIRDQASYVGVRFRPGVAPGFLGISAAELTDAFVPLSHVWGARALQLEDCLAWRPGFATRMLEHALLERLDARPADPLVEALVRELRLARTAEPIASVATRLGTTERTLHRRCVSAIGYGPKTLDRILRFRRAMQAARGGMPLSAAAMAAGYADQAHLTRESRALAGRTPRDAVATADVIL